MDSPTANSRLRVALQLGAMVLFWLAGEALSRLLHLSMPGGLVGLGLVLVLLFTRVLKVGAVKRGADWLLAQILVFFVPAVLGVLDHREFFGVIGLKILFVIVMSTVAVMAVTALVVEFAMRSGLGGTEAAVHG